jgi:RHS repeat-associated protein
VRLEFIEEHPPQLTRRRAPTTTPGCIWPAGQLYQLGHDGFTEVHGYNNMLQLTSESGGAMNMTYSYSSTQNNGRIVQANDARSGEQWSYAYDTLNRLMTAASTISADSRSYTYDGFGNPGTNYLASTNRPSGAPSDNNGNYTGGGYVWDVENRLQTAVANVYWNYDPRGKRVFTETWLYTNGVQDHRSCELDFYGITGQKLAAFQCSYDTSGSFHTGAVAYNLYFGGKLIRSLGVAVVTDRLGSVRATANNSGTESMRYDPYGGELTSTPDGREKWGSYFRDVGTGIDYADQRYKPIGQGSFLNPDPGGIATADPSNPGSWNRYGYGYGDPINLYDPHGLFACAPALCHEEPVEHSGDPDAPPGPDSPQGRKNGSGPPDPREGSGNRPPAKCNPTGSPSVANMISFIQTNYTAAAAVGLNALDVLGWAAAETGYIAPANLPIGNTVSALKSGNLDYFNLTAGSNWINQVTCPAGSNPYWACFGSFQGAAEAAFFSGTPGSYEGVPTVSAGYVLGQQFASGASLLAAFTAMSYATGFSTTPDYGKGIAGAIRTLSPVLNCVEGIVGAKQ